MNEDMRKKINALVNDVLEMIAAEGMSFREARHFCDALGNAVAKIQLEAQFRFDPSDTSMTVRISSEKTE